MSVRQVIIGGQRIGIKDLDEIFHEVLDMGISDEEDLTKEIFERAEARNYIPPDLEDVYKEDLLEEYKVFTGELAGRSREERIMEIRVYGPGCPRCEELDRITRSIIASRGIAADYLHITDIQEIAEKGIAATPALAINDKVVLAGKVPSRQALEKLLNDALGDV